MSMIFRTGAAASVFAALLCGAAGATILRPDEAASKDTFVYAFAIPGTLGIPGAPNMLNFDTESIPATSAVPFGDTLGVAESIPFRNDPSNLAEPIRVHTTHSLLQFDLASLATTAERVKSAVLNLTGIGSLPPFDPPSAMFPILVNLKPVLAAWNEQTVTWDTRPAVGATVSSYLMTDGHETLSFDVTALVKQWLDDPSLNFGFELSQDAVVTTPPGAPGGRNRFATGLFASSANPDVLARPSLNVAEVPLPAGLPLLLGAMGLLGVMRRRSA